MTDTLASDIASMLGAALAYAERGLPVFPCNPATKRPLTPSGFKNATIDPGTIELWWHTWPQAMIGVPTGEVSNCFVLDVDLDPMKGIDGAAALAALWQIHSHRPACGARRQSRSHLQPHRTGAFSDNRDIEANLADR